MWEQTPTAQGWGSCREGQEWLGKGSMRGKKIWVGEGAGRNEAKERQEEEERQGKEKRGKDRGKKSRVIVEIGGMVLNISYHYKSCRRS